MSVVLLLVCCLCVHFCVLIGTFRSLKPGQNIAYFTKTNFRTSLMINQRWFKYWLGTTTSNRRQFPYEKSIWSLLWRHNEPDDVSNHQPHDCLLNRLFGHRSKNTSKLRVTGLCAGNSPETGEFPAQMASNAENVSIWWRHHGAWMYQPQWTTSLHWNPRNVSHDANFIMEPEVIFMTNAYKYKHIYVYT